MPKPKRHGILTRARRQFVEHALDRKDVEVASCERMEEPRKGMSGRKWLITLQFGIS